MNSSTRKAASAQTLTEQYAAKRSKGIVNQAIWTQRIVIGFVALIVVAAMVANYSHQSAYLLDHVDTLTAYIVPAALDLLTAMCAVVLALPVMSKESKLWALGGLVFAVAGSGTLSALAPGDLVGKCVAGGLVALIAAAEFVANHTHVDFRLLAAAETEFVPAEAVKVRKPKTLTEKAAIVAKANATREANRAARELAAAIPTSPGMPPVGELVDAYRS
jgi:hypothetical protein